MPLSNYPRGFLQGITLRGLPILQTNPGQVFFVGNGTALNPGSVAGADGNKGTFNRPFATLQAANDACLASRGDIIIILPGHAETISTATALTLNKRGVAIIGLGTGFDRPGFTLGTVAGATINIAAQGITFMNCQVAANLANVTSAFTLTDASFFALSNCEIYDNSSSLNFLAIVTTSTTTGQANGLSITDNRITLQATSGAVKLLDALGTNNLVTISGNYFQSATTNGGAVIPIAAGKTLGFFQLLNNIFNLKNATGTATGYIITTNGSTNSGFIDGNKDFSLPTTPLFATASSGFSYGLNYHTNTADLQGYLVPAADS